MVEINALPPIEAFILELHKAHIALWVDGNQLRSKAPTGAMTETIRSQIKERKDELIAFLSQAKRSQIAATPIQPIARTALTPIPLSFSQESLWLLEQIERRNTAYNEIGALQFTGVLEVAAFQRALCEIVERHESLRTTFRVNERGEPTQVIHPPAFALPLVDLSHLTEEQQREMFQMLAREEAASPFDLEAGPLFRCKLLCLQGGNQQGIHPTQSQPAIHILLVAMHHLIGDVWSFGVLLQELATLYAAFVAGKPSPLPKPLIQYADYAIWQRTQQGGERKVEALAYWKKALANAPALLQLPTDRPRPAIQSFRGKRVRFTLANELIQPLHTLSQEHDATLFMVLFAAFNVLLARYSHQEEIVIGIPISNRQQREVEGLIGFFVNTLALRTQVNSEQNFLELLTHVKQTTQAAYDHQEISFANVVSAIQPERNQSYSPIFQVMFAMQNIPTLRHVGLGGLQMSNIELELGISKYDLSVELYETTDGLSGTFEYNTDLFDESTIIRMTAHYQVFLQGIVANQNQPIAHLPLLTEAERQQLLVAWNNTATNYPKEKTIHQLFEEQVERTPDAVAVVMVEEKGRRRQGNPLALSPSRPLSLSTSRPLALSPCLTYQELNKRANQLAHYLQSLGVGPEVLVGLCVERSLDMVVGLLGILKAGGAYLPLDPTYPPERLAFMIQDTDTPVLLTQTELRGRLPATTPHLLCLDGDWPPIATQCNTNPASGVQAEHLAYVIYTSGSTGQPKGAMNTHHGLCNLLHDLQDSYRLTTADKTLQTTVFSFDVATSEILWPLLNGAGLVLTQPDGQRDSGYLVTMLQHHQITTLHLAPSLLQVLLEEPAITACISLKRIIVAGEALPAALQNRFFARLPHAQLYNRYGPTETAIYVTAWHCLPQPDQTSVPIGRPIANTQMYVLDRQLQPVPIGVAGELHIGGVQVGRGYWKRSELTQEKFIANPFGEGRLYKTGDLARWLPNGNLEYLGRLDHQVKIRGFRIELGEIEVVLTQHPAVKETVVVLQAEQADNKYLVAYLVTTQGAGIRQDISGEEWQSDVIAQLRSDLQSKLPDYMIPSAFVLLDRLPLTPNGKVDRKALPAPRAVHCDTGRDFVPPRSETERLLASIWCEVLGIQQLSIHDNFFGLGGHSLLATQVVSRIRQMFAIDLPLRTLFAEPTISEIAELIETTQFNEIDQSTLIQLLNEVEFLQK